MVVVNVDEVVEPVAVVLVVVNDGTLAADVRPLIRLSVTVIVEDKGQTPQRERNGERTNREQRAETG